MDNLGGIVDEAERTRNERGTGEQERLRRRPRQQDDGDRDRDEHDDAAHGGRALLHQMALRTIGTHLLADVAGAKHANPQRHKRHGERGGNDHRKEHQKRWVIRKDGEHASRPTLPRLVQGRRNAKPSPAQRRLSRPGGTHMPTLQRHRLRRRPGQPRLGRRLCDSSRERTHAHE